MTYIRKFSADDMVAITRDGIKELGLDHLNADDVLELAQRREDNGQCITGIVDGKIIACGGVDLMWEGVGEVWMFVSPVIDSMSLKFKARAYKIIRDGLEEIIENNNLVRCQAWGRVDFPQSHTILKHLGFKAEGLAECYTPDLCDAILYSRIRRPNGNQR